MDVGYYAPAARTTLNLVFIVFLSEIELILANPRVLTLWVYAGALRYPAVGLHTTTSLSQANKCCLCFLLVGSGTVLLVIVLCLFQNLG